MSLVYKIPTPNSPLLSRTDIQGKKALDLSLAEIAVNIQTLISICESFESCTSRPGENVSYPSISISNLANCFQCDFNICELCFWVVDCRLFCWGKGFQILNGRSRGNQRDKDRERAQARNAKKGPKSGHNDTLTPEQRRERDAKALQEKAARKAAQAAGQGNNDYIKSCSRK